MAGTKIVVVAKRVPWLVGLLVAVSSAVNAERLPIKTYTSADGLTSNRISRIVRDSRGFLWFCTEDGLSRFDGYTFTNYTTHQGLPSNWVDDFLETRSGVFFVATNAGLCVFDPRGIPLPQDKLAAALGVQPMFAAYRPGTDEFAARINVLYEDSRGQIWCGTRRGLYQVEIVVNKQLTFHYVDLGIQSSDIYYYRIRSIVEEASGVLWIATEHELYRRFLDGKIERVKLRTGLPNANLMSLVKESERQFWLCTGGGLWSISQLSSADFAENSFEVKQYAIKEGLACVEVNALFRDSDGKLWVATDCGLYEFLRDEKRFRLRLDNRHLRNARVWSLNEDAYGNLWAGTAYGAIKLVRNGFTTFTEADGIGFGDTSQITETSAGEIRLYTRFGQQNFFIDKFDGERFISQKVKRSAFSQTPFNWFYEQFPVQDSQGEWWWPTQNGLFRFARASRVEELFNGRPIAHYTMKDGLPGNYLYGIYEDRQGDIWISIEYTSKTGVVRWERATGKFYAYSKADGLFESPFESVCEDRQGNLWIGSGNGSIARYQQGRFTTFTVADGVPEGEIKQLLFDSQGRIWIASDIGGLGRIDDPAAERPQIIKYTTAEGLASNSILYVAEDRLNRYFVATTRGLNYIDFDRGSFKRFTTSDGLANDQVNKIFRDSRGAFWFGTATGVSRLVPQAEINQALPSIFINGIKVAGQVQRISTVGETDMQGLELTSNQNQIEIGFGSPSFAAGDLIRYQYKLEGADSDWQFTVQRTINFANLAPGAYRFLVRAINADGVMSEMPASLPFTILPPIWQRWWFLTLAAVLIGLAIYSMYRYQLGQKLEVERVRTRIAGDLHDDIGANLTKIAILSEVAQQQQLGFDNRPADTTLSSIANISRESVASMRDIVWAINPKRDRLLDLTRRMRGFASDIFTSRNLEFEFHAPAGDRELKLTPQVRRDVFLIFKEAVNNIVRHSECAKATIDLGVEGGWLVLCVSDDGRGVDATAADEGQGLASMRRRAESFGGNLEIISPSGSGTTVRLSVPVGRRYIREAARRNLKTRKGATNSL